jgi:CMP-N,N'-diacetyllegionaminic acid synthase
MMKNLILIPARANSKRLPGKNFTKLNGKPLIDYTINICKKLKKYGDIYISTDSDKILKYCKNKNFLETKKRSKKLSSGSAKIIDVIFDLIEKINSNKNYENIILLQPTSPLRKVDDVINCLKIFKKKKLMSLATISKVKVNTSELVMQNSDKLKFIFNKKLRQSESYCYFIDGSIYINSIKFLKKYKSLIIEGKTNLVKLNNNFTVDIDYRHDLVLANYFLKNNL